MKKLFQNVEGGSRIIIKLQNTQSTRMLYRWRDYRNAIHRYDHRRSSFKDNVCWNERVHFAESPTLSLCSLSATIAMALSVIIRSGRHKSNSKNLWFHKYIQTQWSRTSISLKVLLQQNTKYLLHQTLQIDEFVIDMVNRRLHGFRRWNIRNLAVAKLETKTKEIRYRH